MWRSFFFCLNFYLSLDPFGLLRPLLQLSVLRPLSLLSRDAPPSLPSSRLQTPSRSARALFFTLVSLNILNLVISKKSKSSYFLRIINNSKYQIFNSKYQTLNLKYQTLNSTINMSNFELKMSISMI